MKNISKAFILGRVGKDPVPAGEGYRLSVATSEFKKNGEEFEEMTSWHTVLCFGYTAKDAEKCRKGDVVCVEGKLRQSSYTPKGMDEKRYSWSIFASTLAAMPKDIKKAEPLAAEQESFDDDIPF